MCRRIPVPDRSLQVLPPPSVERIRDAGGPCLAHRLHLRLLLVPVMLLTLSADAQASSAAVEQGFEFSVQNVEITTRGEYGLISYRGAGMDDDQRRTGHPALPVITARFLLPPETKVEQLSVNVTDRVQLEGRYLPLPIQPHEGGFAGPDPEINVSHDHRAGSMLAMAPNPVNPVAWVTFRLAQAEEAALSVLDVQGRVVRVLARGEMPAGQYRIPWDGKTTTGAPASSGVYFLRLDRSAGGEVRRVTLVR